MNKQMINEFIRRITAIPLVLPAIFVLLCALSEYLIYQKEGLLSLVFVSLIWIISVLVVLLYSLFNKLSDKVIFTLILLLSLVVFITFFYFNQFFLFEKHNEHLPDEIHNITIKITNIEKNLDGSIKYYAEEDNFGKLIIYDTDSLNENDVLAGDLVTLKGYHSVIRTNTNPGEFNLRNYLNRKGIFYILVPKEIVSIQQNNNVLICGINKFSSIVFDIRKSIHDYLSLYIARDNLSLGSAVLLGDKSELDDRVYRDFKLSDSSHILACSGTHFAAFLLFLPDLLQKVSKSKRRNLCVFSFISLLFGMMTGFGNSVTRAFFMSIIRFSEKDQYGGLSFALIVLMIANPFCLLDSGFEMSFVISAFLISFSRRKESNPIYLTGLTLIALMPFMTTIDYYLSPVNLLVQVILNLALIALCAFFIPCLLSSFFFKPMLWPIEMLINLMRKVVSISATVSLQSFNLKEIYYPLLICIFIFFVVMKLPKMFIKSYLIRIIAVITSICLGLGLAEFVIRPDAKIVFIDVGQGDSILIMTSKYNAIIDGGVYEKGEKTIPAVLDYYGIDSLDFAFITHPDSDHGGGIAALYNMGRIKTLYSSFGDIDSFMELGFDGRPDINVINRGYSIRLSPNNTINVISPMYALQGDNDDSLVMILNSFGTSVLFTGDISSNMEYYLIDNGYLSDINILKVSHHGSKYSTTPDFINVINPEAAVISVGKYNTYGHPSREVVDVLCSKNIPIYMTSTEGAIILDIYRTKYELSGFVTQINV